MKAGNSGFQFDFHERLIVMKTLFSVASLMVLTGLLACGGCAEPTQTEKEEALNEVPAIDLPEKTINELFEVEDGFTLLSLKDFEVFNGKSKAPVEGQNWTENKGQSPVRGSRGDISIPGKNLVTARSDSNFAFPNRPRKMKTPIPASCSTLPERIGSGRNVWKFRGSLLKWLISSQTVRKSPWM